MKAIFEKILIIYHRYKYLNFRKVAIVASLTVCIFANNANAEQSCNITESQITLIKQTFGKHYSTLTNNLLIKHENYKEDGYCVISGMAEHGGGSAEAIVILNDKEVYGAILTENEIYKTQKLDENGKIIIKKDNDYQSILLEKFYNVGLSDLYLIFKNSGGSACPGMFQIISVNQNKEVTASPEFGTCSDLFSDKIEGDKLEIMIPEFGSNDVKVVAVYQDGKVEVREVKITKQELDAKIWK